MPRTYMRRISTPQCRITKDEFVVIDSMKKIKEITKQEKAPKYTGDSL